MGLTGRVGRMLGRSGGGGARRSGRPGTRGGAASRSGDTGAAHRARPFRRLGHGHPQERGAQHGGVALPPHGHRRGPLLPLRQRQHGRPPRRPQALRRPRHRDHRLLPHARPAARRQQPRRALLRRHDRVAGLRGHRRVPGARAGRADRRGHAALRRRRAGARLAQGVLLRRPPHAARRSCHGGLPGVQRRRAARGHLGDPRQAHHPARGHGPRGHPQRHDRARPHGQHGRPGRPPRRPRSSRTPATPTSR